MNLHSPEQVRAMFPENRHVYSVMDLAKRWSCSESVIRSEITSGRLKAFRLGHLWRILASEVEKYECQNTVSSNTEEAHAVYLAKAKELRGEFVPEALS